MPASLTPRSLCLLAGLIALSSALAAPPEAQVSLGLSSGERLELNLDGGLRLLRGDWGVLGASVGLDAQSDLEALRLRGGLYYRLGLTDALDLELGAGGRLNNLDPFRGGLYLNLALGVTFGDWHLRPSYRYLAREGESRLGLALEWQLPLERPRRSGVLLGPDFRPR